MSMVYLLWRECWSLIPTVRNERVEVWSDCWLGQEPWREAHVWMHLAALGQFPCLCLGLYSPTLDYACQSLTGPSSLDFSLTLFPHITQRMCTCVVKKTKTKFLQPHLSRRKALFSHWNSVQNPKQLGVFELSAGSLQLPVVSSARLSPPVFLLTDRWSFSLCIWLESCPTGAFLPCHHQHPRYVWYISQALRCPEHIFHTCRKQAGDTAWKLFMFFQKGGL